MRVEEWCKHKHKRKHRCRVSNGQVPLGGACGGVGLAMDGWSEGGFGGGRGEESLSEKTDDGLVRRGYLGQKRY